MVYELKTKKYYGNAIKVLEIITSSINSTNCEYIGDSMVFNMKTDECSNGSIWKHNGKLMLITSDDMGELMRHVRKHEILLVTSCE
jgi:hypothetical protein